MSAPRHDIPQQYFKKLQTICISLPNVIEETAWVGKRWCVGKKNFAHILMINNGHPPAYARSASSNGPLCVLTFRSQLAEFDPDVFRVEPYFKPVWFANIVGMKIDEQTKWDAVKDHISASYALLTKKQ
jgi:hypothetical protein